MAIDIKFIVDGQEHSTMQEAIEASVIVCLAAQQDVVIDRCVKYTTRKDYNCSTIFTMSYQIAQGIVQSQGDGVNGDGVNGQQGFPAHRVRGVNVDLGYMSDDIPQFKPGMDMRF